MGGDRLALGVALQAQLEGRLDEADEIYRQVLAGDPGNADAWHLCGMLAYARGQQKVAEAHILRAIELKPDFAAARNNLGNVLTSQGRTAEAIACFRRAVELDARLAEGHFNLGCELHAQGQLAEAIKCYEEAIAANAGHAGAHCNLGAALQSERRHADALAAYQTAYELDPNNVDTLFNLGTLLQDEGRLGEAIDLYRKALRLNPAFAEAWFNLGNAWRSQERFDESLACYDRAIELHRDYAKAHANRGVALSELGELSEAARAFERALSIDCTLATTMSDLGAVLLQQGKIGEAVERYDRAIAMDGSQVNGRLNRATAALLLADFERGWIEFEWRWKSKQLRPRACSAPRWNGEAIAGRTILLWAEQGFGDTLQFIRYARLVRELAAGARVIVECQKGMGRVLGGGGRGLVGRTEQRGGSGTEQWGESGTEQCSVLRGVLGIDRIVEAGEELPAFDVHCPLLSLPGVLGTTVETIPADVPYLFAEEGLVEAWGERMEALCGGRRECALQVAQGLSDLPWRIGVNWRGRPGRGTFRLRDIPLAMFARLAELPGVRLVSLQRGEGREELLASGGALLTRRVGSGGDSESPLLTRRVDDGGRGVSLVGIAHPTIIDLGDDVDGVNGAFVDTAAIMRNLDLVITSDTAVAHLAGALGVPVWVGLPFVPDWRWLLERSDSPWYPTMRLFRQPRAGDWEGVFEAMRGALVERMAGR